MSFFHSSSGVIIHGGNFTSINHPPTQCQVLGKRKERDSCEFYTDGVRKRHRFNTRISDELMIMKAHEVKLCKELISGNGYRIHSASHDGRLVVVKMFEGPRAKQDLTTDVAFLKEIIHPNVLNIVGVSDTSENSKRHFALFHGITSEQKMQLLIAEALGTDLSRSVHLSMKAVRGIAAGLSYINSQNIPLHLHDNRKWENFDIFTGHDNEPIILFHLSSTCTSDGPVSQTCDKWGIEMLSGLCRQLFSEANSILYDDSPERKFDSFHREDFPTATLKDAEGTFNFSESRVISNSSNSTENPRSSRTPRREVWWVDFGATNRSLESIKQSFEKYLDRFLLSSSNSLLRRISSPKNNNLRRDLHQCPGYLREEITLTSDASRSAIVSHTFPTQSELCSICGQLVQYAYVVPRANDEEIERTVLPFPVDTTKIAPWVSTQASNAPYTTIASNPASMSFASTFDSPSNSSAPTSKSFLSSPFNFDINSMSTWSPPPTTLQDSQLDDLFAGYLDTINSTDFSIPSTAVSPISHIAAPFRTGTSQTLLSSSLPSAAPQISKSSLDDQSPAPENDSWRKAMAKELITSCEPSPFTLHAADIPCSKKPESPIFPNTIKSDKNVEILVAWNSITSNPQYKDVDINLLCAEFSSKARCDGTRVVLEPQGIHSILETLSKKQ